ncbi:MAG TPA: alkaline phosphatase family protein [Desulfobacterales bacterium]|nr:alkaline phosphatase family protein [Desulfobacterales bacterium]
MKVKGFFLILIIFFLTHGRMLPASAADKNPKMVLQITVDQLRGDLPMRFKDRLGQGGFRYLLENGTHYNNAHYQHANTETAVGHATLATGADPSRHGIVANDWIDQKTGKSVYNTEDHRHHIIDRKPKPHQGVSPRNLLATTIGDELVVDNAGQSRVFSVSVKDRGAILPGGHVGKAFWFSKSSGRFVTSTYYYNDYPEWVKQWNAAKPADRYKGKTWDLLHDRSSYVAGNIDDRPYEAAFAELGRTFPHALGGGSAKYFYLTLTLTPIGDELTLDFTRTLIENEKVGQGNATDYLAISFSSTDYVGHLFGPSSLETEDNILRLDRVLAELFQYVDEKIGLDKTLIVLSGDHGAPEAPEYMAEHGMETGRFPLDWFKKGSHLSDALKKRFGRDDLVAVHSHPYLYLNLDAIEDAKLDIEEVERFVAAEMMKVDGIAYAMTRSDLFAGRITESPIQNQIRRSFHPTRSGNIHMVPEHYWFLHSSEEAEKMGIEKIAAIHGSPWKYDTYVPIFFAGNGVPAQTISRPVGPQDIAATIAAYLEIKPPSGSVGVPLVEVLKE